MIKGVLVSGLIAVLAVGAGLYYDHITAFTGSAPHLPKEWWGQESPQAGDTPNVIPFKISFPSQRLDELTYRLNKAERFGFEPPLDGVGFEYGFNTKFLQTVADFWRTKYVWRDREDFLNSLPQFTLRVQGLKIHFIHAKPTKTAGLKVVPILLVHGWPGSVREFYEMIPLLTTPRPNQDFVFEVIAPSLPGYGFSEAAHRPGLGPAQVAVILHSLMEQLNFKQFYVQGGDWGSIIITLLSQLYPQSVMGLHLNMAFVMPTSVRVQLRLMIGKFFPSLVCSTPEECGFVYPMTTHFENLLEEMGYLHIQATKPDTIGIALRDSPIGLAAYILEKFSTWTNPAWKTLPHGGLAEPPPFRLEDLLDNVMIYWLTGTATTSMRLYSEHFSNKQRALGFDSVPVTVPTGIVRVPNEIANQPRSILEMRYKNIVQLTDFSVGGHFAAFEVPCLLADDIWQFVRTVQHKQTPIQD